MKAYNNKSKIIKHIKMVGLILISIYILLFINDVKNVYLNEGRLGYIKLMLPFNSSEDGTGRDVFNMDYPENLYNEPLIMDEVIVEDEINYIPTHDNIEELVLFEDVKRYLYSIDKTAYVDKKIINMNKILDVDVKTNLAGDQPKILIFHTHSQEDFVDSRQGVTEDTIVGVGSYLADILSAEYDVSVAHDFGKYDIVDGKTVRGNSYERMEPSILKILEEYPSIEILIDLHRDGVNEGTHLVTEINGEKVAKLMFFNGVSCLNDDGKGKYLDEFPNPNLNDNLAFSLNMQLNANKLYPNLMRKIYIKPYRYSLHMKPKSLLVEAGANTNTVEEVKKSMPLLAEILIKTLE